MFGLIGLLVTEGFGIVIRDVWLTGVELNLTLILWASSDRRHILLRQNGNYLALIQGYEASLVDLGGGSLFGEVVLIVLHHFRN